MQRRRTQLVTEGFTVKSTLKNYVVLDPPVAGARIARPYKSTDFRTFYRSPHFPIVVQHGGVKNTIKWKVDIDKLNYNYVLPLFFDGLSEDEHQFALIATQGALDMINHIGRKVLPLVPELIMPIQRAMRTRNQGVIRRTCIVLQSLAKVVGEALVPYFKYILPVLDTFRTAKINIGDGIDYSQRKNECVGVIIQETLQTLETYGGEDAYISIKHMVPSYESCVIHTTAYYKQQDALRLPPLHVRGAKATIFTKEVPTGKSLPRLSTAKTRSTKQDLGSNKPPNCLPPISKTIKSNSPDSLQVTGASLLHYLFTEKPQSTKQHLQRENLQPISQDMGMVRLRPTCLPPINTKKTGRR